MNLSNRRKAFTLIELLIVVAIIAILAAIAVPNFLEAQTRAKVSRAEADMRSVALAIEAYHIDNNAYPLSAVDSPHGDSFNPAALPFTVYQQLTTPISYISSFPLDAWKGDSAATPSPFETRDKYDYRRTLRVTRTSGATGIEAVHTGSAFPHRPTDTPTSWLLFSPGPDKRGDINNDGIIVSATLTMAEWPYYDPTNGTVSRGDIIRAREGSDEALAGM